MTDEEVVRSVAAAVKGFQGVELSLKTIRKISSGSNIWKVLCISGEFDTEFTLYIFPDMTPEELYELASERLSLHLPRWQTTQSA